MRVWINNRNGR